MVLDPITNQPGHEVLPIREVIWALTDSVKKQDADAEKPEKGSHKRSNLNILQKECVGEQGIAPDGGQIKANVDTGPCSDKWSIPARKQRSDSERSQDHSQSVPVGFGKSRYRKIFLAEAMKIPEVNNQMIWIEPDRGLQSRYPIGSGRQISNLLG